MDWLLIIVIMLALVALCTPEGAVILLMAVLVYVIGPYLLLAAFILAPFMFLLYGVVSAIEWWQNRKDRK